jgi:hypothetical protein
MNTYTIPSLTAGAVALRTTPEVHNLRALHSNRLKQYRQHLIEDVYYDEQNDSTANIADCIVGEVIVKCLGFKPRGFLFPRRALQIP